ncbi:MAG: penicillin-binding transpeptidase domain-containing protein [Acidobacteria bacterium]|nr:penicillin-binding transpeptidase domain-containing protein [Acidobacteriota bacterium]
MAETHERTWQSTVRSRVLVTAVLFIVWAVCIEATLVWIQVYRHDFYQERATNQANRTTTLEPRRGDIVDRQGRTLALSVDADSICAIPRDVARPDQEVAAVCDALGDCTPQERETFVQRLSQKKRAFAYLRRQVPLASSARVTALKLAGIFTKPEPKRYYPNRELAAHVLGYLGVDNKGLGGIEQAYNSKISGTPGTILVETDAHHHAFSRVERSPVPGDTLELTIDANLQHVAERELHAGVVANRAAGGSVIVMDPRTGEILALANEPTFNPNAIREYSEESRRNRGVQEIYEPGSTFKVVTASAAMEEHLYSLSDPVDASAGVWRSGTRIVREASNHNYGVLSFMDVIVKSSNVGAIKIGLGLGAERLGRYVRRFGFGTRVFGDLPGETPGMLADPSTWSTSTLASVSMGYEIGVTPMQMVAAVSSVANGGVLLQPRIVRALRHGALRTDVAPVELRRTINADTAATLVEIMEQVVERGTGRAAMIPGYTVAGKTGTARKVINGRYSQSDYHASFVGFVPSRQPAIAMLVVIDSPHAGKFYGGDVAAPVFKAIAAAAMRHLGIPQTLNPIPPVLVRASAAEPTGPEFVPAAGMGGSPRLNVVTGPPTVPDVRGLAAREAVRRLALLGLVARLTGDGVVIDQDPAAGTPLESGRACRLWLERIVLSSPPSAPQQ